MKTVIFQSDDEQKLNLLIQLAKEMGVEVIQNYNLSDSEGVDAVSEADERYTSKQGVEVADKKVENDDDYCLPGPPISEEEMDAWLAKDDDEEGVEFTAEEFISYIQKKREDKRK